MNFLSADRIMVTENMRRFYNKAVGYLSGPNSSGSEPSIVEPNQPDEIYTSWLVSSLPL